VKPRSHHEKRAARKWPRHGSRGGAEGQALVSTIISLAHALKLTVVAEGVETIEQRRLLRLLHCDEMQGFLFSEPLPCDAFEMKFLSIGA
jgi:EAL domain-containing protein (putative c-di-GMP-specific phosphodiesterase class I)